MPVTLIQLHPKETTQDQQHDRFDAEIYDANLQIIFSIEDKHYVIAGICANKVLTSNGGYVDARHGSYFSSLNEKLQAETFDVCCLQEEEGVYYFFIKDVGRFALDFQEDKTVLSVDSAKHGSLTFTAICKTASLKQLQDLAALLTPTAAYWNKLGDYLYIQYRDMADECIDKLTDHMEVRAYQKFLRYWEARQEERQKLFRELGEEYKASLSGKTLLVSPYDIFYPGEESTREPEAVFDKLHHLASYGALGTIFNRRIRYLGGRSSYQVIDAANLLYFSQKNSLHVTNENGVIVANGIYNQDVVNATFPTLNIKAPETLPEPNVAISSSTATSSSSSTTTSSSLPSSRGSWRKSVVKFSHKFLDKPTSKKSTTSDTETASKLAGIVHRK